MPLGIYDRETDTLVDALANSGAGCHGGPWRLYDTLIDGIPEGVQVRDYALGLKWSYVEAECGMGMSYTLGGGNRRKGGRELRGLPLREVAGLAKSWNFSDATLGIAALNAWYGRRDLLDPLGAAYDQRGPQAHRHDARKTDAFELYRPEITAKDNANVVVVGHFPHVARIAEYANLTVLERMPDASIDTPDPGCEYVVPYADYLFLTGVTLTNKTAPRLLELGRNATTVFVGPSVVMAPALFNWGVEMLAGSVVADPERTRHIVTGGTGQVFGEAVLMAALTRPEE